MEEDFANQTYEAGLYPTEVPYPYAPTKAMGLIPTKQVLSDFDKITEDTVERNYIVVTQRYNSMTGIYDNVELTFRAAAMDGSNLRLIFYGKDKRIVGIVPNGQYLYVKVED